MAAADFSAAAFRGAAPESLIEIVQETPDGFPAHTLPFRVEKQFLLLERAMAAADFSAAACWEFIQSPFGGNLCKDAVQIFTW